MSLHRIERELRESLDRHRPALRAGLDRVDWTDDGGTVYVHVFATTDWPLVREGDAFVLAHANYPDLGACSAMRGLLEEARLYMHDEIDKLFRWLEGK